MNCPVCIIKLQVADRQGVEINVCPECRGVWIARGGLDKIIDRSGVHTSESRFGEGGGGQHKHDRHHESEGHRRKSFFSDLFD